MVVTEGAAELADSAADGALEDEDEVRAKNVLDVIPRLLEAEADDGAKELELGLLDDDPGRVALTESCCSNAVKRAARPTSRRVNTADSASLRS